METLAYFNGVIGELDEVMVPFNDRSHWFGDGVYDATCGGNHIPFALEDHIDRFYNSARLVDIQIEQSKDELNKLLRDLTKRVSSPQTQVYWHATRGTANRNHVYPVGVKPNLFVMIRPFPLVDLDHRETAITVEDNRFLMCNVKTLNLLPNVLAAEKAKQAGADEAIFHRGSRVTECAHSNVHILKDGVFRTAPLDNLILPGIARKHLCKLCDGLGIPVLEEAFTVYEMMDADEVMVSSASTFGVGLKSIDEKPVGGKAPALLKRIQDAAMIEFFEYTQQPEKAAAVKRGEKVAV
ncbi:MAG: aminotransferase class IV [Oscillospiraceae bacterium]|jgi:D-alanine transaminase|nr:aminotransferase class IV [Oscillospiraceae bacterium]